MSSSSASPCEENESGPPSQLAVKFKMVEEFKPQMVPASASCCKMSEDSQDSHLGHESSQSSSGLGLSGDFSVPLSDHEGVSVSRPSTQEEALRPVYHSSSKEVMLSGGGEGKPFTCTACKSVNSTAVANCFSCAKLLCANCVVAHQLMIAFEGHTVASLGQHPYAERKEDSSETGLRAMLKETRKKLEELQKTSKTLDFTSSRLSTQYEKAVGEVAETYNFYVSMLGERRGECIKELEKAFGTQQVQLSLFGQKCQESVDNLEQMIEFMEKLAGTASPKDIVLFQSSLESRLATYFAALPHMDQANCQLEFHSNFQAIQVGVKNQFGYVKSGAEVGQGGAIGKQPPISRPPSTFSQIAPVKGAAFDKALDFDYLNNLQNNNTMSSFNLLGMSNLSLQGLSSSPTDYLSGIAAPVPSPPLLYPPKAHIKRQKMIYHCKFGEFGILGGQFTEPSGVAVTPDNEIVVADTNNHRIQVFDKEGNFKFQFGEVGKRDGQLLYPNRVAVVASTGDIVVTERSPTHQVQIFNKYGQFMRKFGADVLQHPRGVAVDHWGRIVVVECKVMRVVIFDMVGNVLGKFSCSRHLEFPNGVAVNDNQEVFISDNRAHCVKVFDYQGNYLRQIGGEGVSNFPIGVGVTASGDIAIADNHNNFNLTVFNQAGQLLGALESKVKHAQCFDMALMKDGSIVLASKDYRLYIYRYVKVPGVGTA